MHKAREEQRGQTRPVSVKDILGNLYLFPVLNVLALACGNGHHCVLGAGVTLRDDYHTRMQRICVWISMGMIQNEGLD